MNKKLYIVDGYSLIYRAYFGFITKPLTTKDGKNISAYFGFFNTVFMLLKDYDVDYLVIAFDHKDPTFRHKMYSEYKANRDKAPDDLHSQIPYIKETLDKMQIAYVEQSGFEADDLIATLCTEATKKNIDSIMVTGDKDLLQLVNESVSALRPPKKNQAKYELFGPKEVLDHYQIRADQIIDYLAITGDSADNVPGVKGIGDKGAVKLLVEYETLDGVYRHLNVLSKGLQSKLENDRENAYLSRDLVKLKCDVFHIDDFLLYSTDNYDYIEGSKLLNSYSCPSLARNASALANKKGVVKEETEEKKEVEKKYLALGEYKYLEASYVKAYLEEASRGKGIIALSFYKKEETIIGFSFSYSLKKAFYVSYSNQVRFILKNYLEEKKLKIVTHDAKELFYILDSLDIEANIIFDTMIASWLLDSSSQYSFNAVCDKYLSYEVLEKCTLIENQDEMTKYMGEVSDLTFRLYELLKQMLEDEKIYSLYQEYENPLIKILFEAEKEGILIDKDFMKNLESKYSAKKDELTKKIYSLAGYEFNINSTLQLGKLLYEERGLTASKKTQRGYSTDTPTLEFLLSSGDEIIKYILEYRTVAKLLSTYIEALPKLADKNDRIHTSFLQIGTATGRLSSRNPNLQNIPIRSEEGRLIRSAFVAKEGYTFLSADYSQIELVLLASLSNDENLLKAFNEGLDVHKYTASLIFEKNIEEVTSQDRRTAKTINFGIMYGMSAFRLSNELDISRFDAKLFIEKYFTRYSGVKAFIDEVIKKAEINNKVSTLGGHSRFIMGINSRNKNEKQAAERIAVNTIIQGTAAEIMKKAMIEINKKIITFRSKLLLQVHDELIFEVENSEMEKMMEIVKDTMENIIKLNVKLSSSLETASRWGEMH